jgi:hypothetical protein
MQNIVEIPVTDIVANSHYQGRLATNTEIVEQYREALVRGDTFPPIQVFSINGQMCVTDGFHRLTAHRLAGRTSILAIVTAGTESEALESALQANQTHGLPRSNADKRLLVQRALELETFKTLSDRELAKKLRVSAPFIGKINRQARKSSSTTLTDETEIPLQVKTFSPGDDPISPKTSGTNADNERLDAPHQAHMNEIELLREGLAMYEKENHSLKDQLAAAMISSSLEDQKRANEYIKGLREEIRLLDIELNSVKISRDTLMQEKSQLIRQVRYWERQAKKQVA